MIFIQIFIRPFEKRTYYVIPIGGRVAGGTNDVCSLTLANPFQISSNFGIMLIGIISRMSTIMSKIVQVVHELWFLTGVFCVSLSILLWALFKKKGKYFLKNH